MINAKQTNKTKMQTIVFFYDTADEKARHKTHLFVPIGSVDEQRFSAVRYMKEGGIGREK